LWSFAFSAFCIQALSAQRRRDAWIGPLDFWLMGPLSMSMIEKPLVIDEAGTTVPGSTFNGSVPGPLMVVQKGDYLPNSGLVARFVRRTTA